MKKQPSVEISILCYNQWASTLRLLKSLVRCTKYSEYSVTVVDNASDDETSKGLIEWKEKGIVHKIITNEENIGFAKGHNQVMKSSNADYFCLLNNDIEVSEKWLEKLIKIISKNILIGMITPVNRTRGQLIIGGHLLYSGHGKLLYEEDRGKKKIDWLQASCLLIKRELVNKIGYFDEQFSPGYYEDVDLCLRAQRAGYLLECAKNVIVEHYEGVTSKSSGLKKYQEINREKFRTKWDEWFKLNK